MTASVLVLGLLAGLDNLQVCSSISLLPLRRARRHALAAAFSACEIAGPLLGLILGRALLAVLSPFSAKIGPAMVFVCGAFVLWQAFRQQGAEESVLLFGLPLSLSLDNLVVGAGVSAVPGSSVESALAIGGVSAAMSCAGIYCGQWLRRLVPDRVEVVAGAYLCVLAVRMFIMDGI